MTVARVFGLKITRYQGRTTEEGLVGVRVNLSNNTLEEVRLWLSVLRQSLTSRSEPCAENPRFGVA
jgi:hypothetical protein